MNVKNIAAVIERIFPLELAQDWDNVGLLIGDSHKSVKSVLLTIDTTSDVVAEAKKLGTDLIVSYHPVIWDGLKSITAEGPSSVVYELVRSGISVFSVHTALDSAMGGVNDSLAEIVGIKDGEPIGDYVANPAGDNFKLVVFVPLESVEKVSNAVFAAGAGAIGNYSHCGFGTDGTGTFLPLKGARPAIGRKGKLEKVHEVRFETIIPAEKLGKVVAAMKKAHPYETPAFDVFKHHSTEAKFGLGRIGELAQPLRITKIVERIK
ncbi:MAG: Nif3-like dinuclear metal center hexameric protein, partial [Planctomycetota bacterium]|nr:Nif3-like dinuclear metal center hexameric protein [Planctomycetota bacterium]